MADLKLEVPHALSRDEAISRLEQVFSNKEQQDDMLSDVKCSRKDDRLTFSATVKGFKVSGKMAVQDQRVRMIITIPLAASAFSKSADKYIRNYLKKRLV